MKPRTRFALVLIALQVLGGATFLAYPVILMGLLFGEGDQGLKTRLLVASLVWPVLLVLLWILSWLALGRGRTLLALALSAPPALVFAFGVRLFVVHSHRSRQSVVQMKSEEAGEIENARKQNPLAGEILALEAGQTKWPGLQEVIARADPELLSRPVDLAPRGLLDARRSTPLALALQGSHLDFDSSKTRPHFLEAARLLIGRGARLSSEEESTAGSTAGFDLPWMVEVVESGTELPDRAAASENPLVWRIMTADYADPVTADISAAKRSHPEQLSRATTTYGTPLHAAILRGSLCQRCDGLLVAYGAQLSESERKVPRLVARVEAILATAGQRTDTRRPLH